MTETAELLTIRQASEWATEYLGKEVTPSNISYLVQYGRVRKATNDGATCIRKQDLIEYYQSYLGKRETDWKRQLGADLNWRLSFDYLKEAETTRHVHRLHPYKGKFIPQLVAYFLDDHTDEFKQDVYFRPGDIVLDPFCGSGTTLVQANELGMHAVGIDVSAFNALISNIKVGQHDLFELHQAIRRITIALKEFAADSDAVQFETRLLEELARFNNQHFPSPEYKRQVRQGLIDEKQYGPERAREFLWIYHQLVADYGVQLKQAASETFIDKWYLQPVRAEIDFVFERVKQIESADTRAIVGLILSRTIRSCRATTHADLATLVELVTTTYYCAKHGKICKPLFSMLGWWERYSKDTLRRLSQFNSRRTDTCQVCLTGDSRELDLVQALQESTPALAALVQEKKIKGIFSSPPYVGLINYHEQHAYAYDLFGFERNDELEIGPLFRGKGKDARESYVQGVSGVLRNCKRFLAEDYDVFLVANDKFNMYATIAERAGMQIVNQFKRPVLNRTERDKAAYSETIFHLKSAGA